MKKLKAFLGFAAAVLLAGCNNIVDVDSESQAPSAPASVQKTYKLSQDEEGRSVFTLTLGATQSKDSRTIAPTTPDLYWTVFGSTKTSGDDYADYGAGVSDGDKSTVWIPGITALTETGAETKNVTEGISFTIGAINGKQWYFSAYATKEAPEDIDGVSFSAPDNPTDAELTAAVTAIQTKAIVKGTVSFKITIDETAGTVTLTPVGSYTSPTTIKANDTATATTKGTAIIPVSLPTTTGLDYDYYKVDSVTLSLTKNGAAAATKYTITGIDGATANFAFTPELEPGKYDVELTFNHAADTTTKAYEVFSHYDTLTVKGNYTSYVSESTRGDFTATDVDYTGTASTTGDTALSAITTTDAGKAKGYTLTEALIKSYKRDTFYVAGSGTLTAPTDATKATGSKVLPFASVADAVAKIPQIADGAAANGTTAATNTTWTIIVDGANTDTTAVNITNNTAKVATVIIKALGTSATVAAPLTVTSNAGATIGDVKVILQNVTFSNTVTVGTPYFYLNKSVLSGTVTLNKEDTTKNGTLNADPSDTVSKALSITLEGTAGKTVVKRCTFGTDGLPADAGATDTFSTTIYKETDVAATQSTSAQYRLVDTYITANYTAANGDTPASGYKRYLRVATDNEVTAGDTGAKGDLVVKYQSDALTIDFNDTTVTGSATFNQTGNTIAIQYTITDADNKNITGVEAPTYKLFVYGDNPEAGDIFTKGAATASAWGSSYAQNVTLTTSSIYFENNKKYVLQATFTVGDYTGNVSYDFTYTE